jgi:hypothetical protein
LRSLANLRSDGIDEGAEILSVEGIDRLRSAHAHSLVGGSRNLSQIDRFP